MSSNSDLNNEDLLVNIRRTLEAKCFPGLVQKLKNVTKDPGVQHRNRTPTSTILTVTGGEGCRHSW